MEQSVITVKKQINNNYLVQQWGDSGTLTAERLITQYDLFEILSVFGIDKGELK